MFPDKQFSIVHMDFNDNTSKNSRKLITLVAEGQDEIFSKLEELGSDQALVQAPVQAPDRGPKSYISSKELQNLNAPGDETSRFMEDFDPSRRRSDKTKPARNGPSYIEDEGYIEKEHSHQSQRKKEEKKVLYDNQGVLLYNQRDLCDCLSVKCPGCHFRCPKCQSPKCGHECRNNRRWQYNFIEVEGDPGAFRENEFISKPDDRITY